MGRMTRKKAAEVAEKLHIDEDTLLDLPSEEIALASKCNGVAVTPEPTSRSPLGELAPNSADSRSQSDDASNDLKKSTRGRKGGKTAAAKGKKADLAASTTVEAEMSNVDGDRDISPDELVSPPSPASGEAVKELLEDGPILTINTIPTSYTPSPAVELTRDHLNEQSEPKSLVDGLGQTAEEQQDIGAETVSRIIPVIETTDSGEVNKRDNSIFDKPASPLATAIPKVLSHLRTETPAKRSVSNKENIEPEDMASPTPSKYDHLEEAVIAAGTPSPSRSPAPTSRTPDPIVALDQTNDAIETAHKEIPEVQTSPEEHESAAPPPAAETGSMTDASTKPDALAAFKKRREKAAPVVRTTKAAAARLSMAHSKDAVSNTPSLGRPRQSMALGRASSVREVSGNKRIPSNSSVKDLKASEGEKKEVVIPHSKPRPISMSFPTPPPPPKSRKALTQSTFQLPGDAIAAKLKAAREARQQKEAEEVAKKPAFKARPVPSTLSKAPSVRQTNASRARESIMNGKDLKTSTSGTAPGHGRANSVATTRPSVMRASIVSTQSSKPAVGKPSVPLASAKPRASTAMANISKPRDSTTASTGTRVTSTSKGKEVFNRAAVAKANAAKEKEEREAAAKKARADAAERSRQLSREFAEKQKAKKAAAAARDAAANSAGAAVVA